MKPLTGILLAMSLTSMTDRSQLTESPRRCDVIAQSTQRCGGEWGDPVLALRQKGLISDQGFEFQDDPYKPNVPPGSQRLTTPAQVWIRGDFRSVQVNVDSDGNNIVGDAANEPSIAVDPNDPSKMVIGWRQFDTIESNFRQGGWAYSHDSGRTWTFPGVLQPQVFRSDPVLDSDSAGNIYYYSLSSLTSCDMFISRDSGLSWEGPIPAFGGDKAWMVVDKTGGLGDGNVYAQWGGAYIRSTDGGLTYSFPTNVPTNPFWGTMSVGPDGALYVSGANGVVLRSSNAQDGSVVTSFEQVSMGVLGGLIRDDGGPNPTGLLGQVWVATDHSTGPTRGNVYVLASVRWSGIDPLDVMFVRSTDGGLTWSEPVRVNDDSPDNGAWQWFGTMSVAPNGRIDVVWNDTRASGVTNISELYYSFSTDAGETWSVNEPVTPPFDSYLGWPQQAKLGDYYHMVSNETGANLAYAATFNGEQDVYFVRLNDDCNENGVPDLDDIDAGTSHDCNQNGLPDDCEPDCNLNNTADECDIAGGGSGDCNENRIPDDCEPDEDCNGNDVQDICDIAAEASRDCNENSVPDECEMDCNSNSVPDDCDITDGFSRDCNANGVPDECDLVTDPDCNGNDRLDECDVAGFVAASGRLSPIGSWSPQRFTIPAPPLAIHDVSLSFSALADLNAEVSEQIHVDINATPVGAVFATGANDCPAIPDVDEIIVPASVFNSLAAAGTAINMVPSTLVDPILCSSNTFIEVSVTYETAMDCNGSGIPDDCEIRDHPALDAFPPPNGNGILDYCEETDICGDGIIFGIELCDDAAFNGAGEGYCLADCSGIQVCGDGIANGTEVCDDGEFNGTGEGFCLADCSAVQACGDGVVNGTEVCDGLENAACEGQLCRRNCTCAPATCGNGRRDDGEACDGDDDGLCRGHGCKVDCTCRLPKPRTPRPRDVSTTRVRPAPGAPPSPKVGAG